MSKLVDLHVANAVATLTLNRPEVRNTVNCALVSELRTIVDDLSNNQDVRVVVITGSGELAFCAGIDHAERAAMSSDELREFFNELRVCFDRVAALPQPVIAAINGFATGVGTELALCADVRLCAQSATLGLTDVRFGVIPAAGGTPRLVRLVGVARAKEMIMTGRRVSARDALRLGLCNQVGNDDELPTLIRQWSEEFLTAAPLAVAQAKRVIEACMDQPLGSAVALEAEAFDRLLDTSDRKEAIVAFSEKRNPDFTGT